MAKIYIAATNKNGQIIEDGKFLAIYRASDGRLFTGNKGYESIVAAIRGNETAVGAIKVSDWLTLAKEGGIERIDEALSAYC